MTEIEAALGFALFNGIGPATFQKLLKNFGSAKEGWLKLDSDNRQSIGIGEKVFGEFDEFRRSFNPREYLAKLKKTKVTFVPRTDKKYPESLKKLARPPIGLFCRGNLELLASKQNMGVVGARKITSYGREVTEKLTTDLVNYGFTIVSGLAMGVDATAHKTTLDNHGNTIAVLGCGVDCCTPEENYDLYLKILDSEGLIVSEYPLGMPASTGSFPARNRIIAGLSLGILVTEAAEDSGSLITAEEAIKLERPVFAVPGGINSQMSRGTLKLIRGGATLVQSAGDILEKLQVKSSHFAKASRDRQKLKLSADEEKVVRSLENEQMGLDDLVRKTKIPLVKLMVIVSGLEMRGVLENNRGEIKIKS